MRVGELGPEPPCPTEPIRNIEDKMRLYMFLAACGIIGIVLAYVFLCLWVKPAIDLTVPMVGLVTFLLGFYYGSSKSSQDKDRVKEVK